MENFRSRFRAASTLTVAESTVSVKGPKGELQPAIFSNVVDVKLEDGKLIVARKGEDKPHRSRARPHAHADRQHDRRREQGLPQEPRDSRRRLPRRKAGEELNFIARLLAPGRLRSRRRASRSRSRARTKCTSTASTSKPSAKSPPRFAICVRPSRTRAKASATKAKSSVRNSVKPERQARSNGADFQSRPASRAPRPPAQEGHRDGRASAPAGAPHAAPHLRDVVDDAKGAHPRRGVDRAKVGRRGTGVASTNVDAAKAVGSAIAAKAKDAGITAVVFDRGGNRYHGRVRALADAAREAGLNF